MASLFACVAVGMAGDFGQANLDNVSTSAVSTTTEQTGFLSGHLDAIAISVTNTYDIYISGSTTPAIDWFFTAKDTYSNTEAFVSSSGNYWLWNSGRGTNFISSKPGIITGVAWASTNTTTTGRGNMVGTNYLAFVGATGVMAVAETTIDFDVEIGIVDGVGMISGTREILSVENITTDKLYLPRFYAHNTKGQTLVSTNQFWMYPLYRNKIYVKASNATQSNVNAHVQFLLAD